MVTHWNPRDGRGDVVSRLSNGDLLRTTFHLGFAGYTGGLIIGNYNGSGLGFYPRQPIHGFRRINVFCAQDESLWDRDEQREYSYGWSENFGQGADGQRLNYLRGRVLEKGDQRITLQSENAGGCYRVLKLATTRAQSRFWIIATRVINRCPKPVNFDFFSGDDPWLGLYKSSDGDVGWTAAGPLHRQTAIVRRERVLHRGEFSGGGIYDLGNHAAGQQEGAFSGMANFVALDPALPLPDLAIFANRFAHSEAEVDPRRPLSNKTLTALNLGWLNRRLAPGDGLTFAVALGLAQTARGTQLPTVPLISDADWSIWRRYLREGQTARSTAEVLFAAERVEIDLQPKEIAVDARYALVNPATTAQTIGIVYPVLTASDLPAPQRVTVDGRSLAVGRSGLHFAVRFTLALPPRAIKRFVVRYRQRHYQRRAGYMVTSAQRWPAPIARAVFVVRSPASMEPLRTSFAVDKSERLADGRYQRLVVRQPFAPKQEFWLRWK